MLNKIFIKKKRRKKIQEEKKKLIRKINKKKKKWNFYVVMRWKNFSQAPRSNYFCFEGKTATTKKKQQQAESWNVSVNKLKFTFFFCAWKWTLSSGVVVDHKQDLKLSVSGLRVPWIWKRSKTRTANDKNRLFKTFSMSK